MGASAQKLVDAQDLPSSQIPAPSGATVYIYPIKSLAGTTILCVDEYYIRNNKVVGFRENGSILSACKPTKIGETD